MIGLEPVWVSPLTGKQEPAQNLTKSIQNSFFSRPSPDGSIVWVVLSFPAGTMGDGAEPDKTRPKPDAFKFFPDERRVRAIEKYKVQNEKCKMGREPARL